MMESKTIRLHSLNPEDEMWDLKSFPNVISYNRMKTFQSSAEIYYSKVTMFSQLSHTQRGSFLSNIITIPLWFLGLIFGAILILSALTKWFERANQFGIFVWMYFGPLFQQTHLLNIWFATLIVLNIVILSYITAEVLVGQKVILNNLKDILRVKNLQYVTRRSDAMQDFFKGIPGTLGERIRERASRERINFDSFSKVGSGEMVYIDWHEEMEDLDKFCKETLKNKIDGRPLLYQSPFPLKIDFIAFQMKRNHSVDAETVEGINRNLRYAASSCLCDNAIYKTYWWMNNRCVTTDNHVDESDYNLKENETRLLLAIYACSLIPPITVIAYEILRQLFPCFKTKAYNIPRKLTFTK